MARKYSTLAQSGQNVGTEKEIFNEFATKWDTEFLVTFNNATKEWDSINEEVYKTWEGKDRDSYEVQYGKIKSAIELLNNAVQDMQAQMAAEIARQEQLAEEAASGIE